MLWKKAHGDIQNFSHQEHTCLKMKRGQFIGKPHERTTIFKRSIKEAWLLADVPFSSLLFPRGSSASTALFPRLLSSCL